MKFFLPTLLFFCSLRVFAAESRELPVPPSGTYGLNFMSRPEVNDAQLFYAFSDVFALGFHGIRNHWPTKVELHFALLQLNARLFELERNGSRFSLFSLTGGGLANKLRGVDRFAHLIGLEGEVETRALYGNLQASTIGARDYDRKNFVRVRAGFYPYRVEERESLQSLFMMHALYENHATHRIEWGPMMRFSVRNVALELYGNFKGQYSFAFSFFL